MTWFMDIREKMGHMQAGYADYKSAVEKVMCADVAQLAEQLICNQQVNGSSPFIGL